MKFISAEEFLKQPIDMQKLFLDWWKCDLGDLFIKKFEYELNPRYCNVLCINIDLESDIEGDWDYLKQESIPLFSEGQLRQFIEDITKDKYDILYSLKAKENIGFYKYTENETQPTYEVETHDLLQAYWKVATEIASKEIKPEMNRHSQQI